MVALAPRIPKTHARVTAPRRGSRVGKLLSLAADGRPARGGSGWVRTSGAVTGTKYGVPSAQLNPATPYANYATYNKLQTFVYDGVGNRQEFDDGTDTYLYNRPAGGGAYSPSNVNEYYRIRKNGVDTSRTYDANGNLTNDGTFAYKYNYRNQLIEVDPAGGGAAVQTQNFTCIGTRVFKTDSNGTNYFYHGSPEVIETHDGTDAVIASFVYGRRMGEVLTSNTGGSTYYASCNDRFSVAHWSDPSGNNVEKDTYDASGKPATFDWLPIPGGGSGWVSVPSSKYAPFMFTGREWDSTISQYSFFGRQYEPAITGALTARMPHSNRLGNMYTFAANRPLYMPALIEQILPLLFFDTRWWDFQTGPYCIPVGLTIRHHKGQQALEPLKDPIDGSDNSELGWQTRSNGEDFAVFLAFEVDIPYVGDCELCRWGQYASMYFSLSVYMGGAWQHLEGSRNHSEYERGARNVADEGGTLTRHYEDLHHPELIGSRCCAGLIYWEDDAGMATYPVGRTELHVNDEFQDWANGTDGSHVETTWHMQFSVIPFNLLGRNQIVQTNDDLDYHDNVQVEHEASPGVEPPPSV